MADWVVRPLEMRRSEYSLMQSTCSHSSTSSFVRYDEASDGEWPEKR